MMEVNPQPVHAGAGGIAVETENRRGSAWAFISALHVGEHPKDVLAFDLLQRRGWAGGSRRVAKGVVHLADRGVRDDAGALDDVLQLADVAWPSIAEQPLHALRRQGDRRLRNCLA